MKQGGTGRWFVTGTDTGVGKTWITAGLMRLLAARGFSTAGMKPVASGSRGRAGALRNEDAEIILGQCTTEPDYADVNPFALEEPIAPHLAAEHAGRTIALEPIRAAFERLRADAGAVVVEGIGGWRVPLARHLQTVDVVRALELPVIMVVGLRLGCISHARLTADAVRSDGVSLCGWVANVLDPDYLYPEAAVSYLQTVLDAPLLGVVPPLDRFDADRISQALDADLLLSR